MSDWVEVASVADFPPGSVRSCAVDGVQIAVFNLGGSYYAIEDLCSHEASTLADGKLEGEEIVCPLHGAHFCIRTGAALSPPAYEAVPTFPVRVDHGVVQVRDERWD